MCWSFPPIASYAGEGLGKQLSGVWRYIFVTFGKKKVPSITLEGGKVKEAVRE